MVKLEKTSPDFLDTIYISKESPPKLLTLSFLEVALTLNSVFVPDSFSPFMQSFGEGTIKLYNSKKPYE